MTAQGLKKTNKGKIYFHVYNRGIANGIIFNDKQDYEVFLSHLEDYLTLPKKSEDLQKTFTVKGRAFRGVPHQPKNYFNKVELIAYCLTPDHFHLLLCPIAKDSLEGFMRSLSTKYSIYFNKKYQRQGSLFGGPYKSVSINDATCLLNMTHYLHQHLQEEKGNNLIDSYSSYADYLGKRKTSWVKASTVLSFFENFKNEFLKGIKSYKDFVEKYNLNQREKRLLERIIIEKESGYLEKNMLTLAKRNVTRGTVAYAPLKIYQRIPEFAAASFFFAVLFTSSFLNIRFSSTQRNNPILTLIHQASEQVSTQTLKQSLTQALGQASTQILRRTSTQTLEQAPTQTPEQTSTQILGQTSMLVVKIDESASANIRQSPTTDSKVIGEAKNGDTFEFVSENSGWYEIKLDNGSTAFISASVVELLVEEI
ncbi:MAG TPA: SH3 domain-containing protein [Patescibacteria group bacterium]|nr:SH3 domain-containing protein [Patescibacteria group bacterium]